MLHRIGFILLLILAFLTFVSWMENWITPAHAVTILFLLLLIAIVILLVFSPREVLSLPLRTGDLDAHLETKYNRLVQLHDNTVGFFKTAFWVWAILVTIGTYLGVQQLSESRALLTNLKGNLNELYKIPQSTSRLFSMAITFEEFANHELNKSLGSIELPSSNPAQANSPLKWMSKGELITMTKEVRLLIDRVRFHRIPALQEQLLIGSIDGNVFSEKSEIIEDFLGILEAFMTQPETNPSIKKKKYIYLIGALDEILSEDPDFPEVRELLGRFLLQKHVFNDQIYKRRADAFFTKLEGKLEEQSDKYTGELKNLGLYYYLMGDLEKSRKKYELAIKLKPKKDAVNERILYNLASVYLILAEQLKQLEKKTHEQELEMKSLYKLAVKYNKQALEINPYSPPANNDLAWIYSTAHEWDKSGFTKYIEYKKIAIDYAQKALKLLRPDSSYDYFLYLGTLAKTYRGFRMYKEALSRLNEAINLGKQKQADFGRRGIQISDTMEKYRNRRKDLLIEARGYYKRLERSGDQSPTVYSNLAYFYKFSLLAAKEEKDQNRAREIIFGHGAATEASEKQYSTRKKELHSMVETLYKKAIARQESAIQYLPRSTLDPQWLFYLGVNLEYDENYDNLPDRQLQSRLKKIRGYYHLALKQDPGYHKAINNLAWLYANEGKETFKNGLLAIELAEKAADSTDWKDFEHEVHTLTEALVRQGDIERAIAITVYAFYRNSWSCQYMEKPFLINKMHITPKQYFEDLRKKLKAKREELDSCLDKI